MCTSRIDVCAANPTLTPIEDLEVIKNPESTVDMTEAAQLKASYMSDHYIVRVQLQVPKLAQHRAAQPCNYTKATLMQLHSATKELEQGAVCTCIRTGCETALTQSLGQGAKDHMCCSLECEQTLMIEQEREAQTFWNKVSTKYRRMLTCEAQLVQQHDKREKLVEVLSWGHEDIIESWVQDTRVVNTDELVEATVQCAIHMRQFCIEQGTPTEQLGLLDQVTNQTALRCAEISGRNSIKELVSGGAKGGVLTALAASRCSLKSLRLALERNAASVKRHKPCYTETARVQEYCRSGDRAALQGTRFQSITVSERSKERSEAIEKRIHGITISTTRRRRTQTKGAETSKVRKQVTHPGTVASLEACAVASVSLEEHNTVTQLPNECCYFSRQGFRKSDARERNGQSKAEQRALKKGADKQFLSRMMDQLVRGAATSSTAKLHGFMGVGHGGDSASLNMEYTQCLYDTGCSFIIVSEAEFRRRCRDRQQDPSTVLQKYPHGVQTPSARTAKKGQNIEGIGLIPITIEFASHKHAHNPESNLRLNMQDLTDLEYDSNNPEWTSDNIVIETYAHVFKGVATPVLLGMPFKRQHVVHDEGSQLGLMHLRSQPVPMDLLDDEAGGRESDGLIHYQSSLDTPIMPLVAYAKEDVWVEPGAEAAIPIYFPGRSVFSAPRALLQQISLRRTSSDPLGLLRQGCLYSAQTKQD